VEIIKAPREEYSPAAMWGKQKYLTPDEVETPIKDRLDPSMRALLFPEESRMLSI
jgi:hypothetical protein